MRVCSVWCTRTHPRLVNFNCQTPIYVPKTTTVIWLNFRTISCNTIWNEGIFFLNWFIIKYLLKVINSPLWFFFQIRIHQLQIEVYYNTFSLLGFCILLLVYLLRCVVYLSILNIIKLLNLTIWCRFK